MAVMACNGCKKELASRRQGTPCRLSTGAAWLPEPCKHACSTVHSMSCYGPERCSMQLSCRPGQLPQLARDKQGPEHSNHGVSLTSCLRKGCRVSCHQRVSRSLSAASTLPTYRWVTSLAPLLAKATTYARPPSLYSSRSLCL